MASMGFTKCPLCGETPVQVQGPAPEAIRSGVVEFLPEAGAVDHWKGRNGHEWFDWEEREERPQD